MRNKISNYFYIVYDSFPEKNLKKRAKQEKKLEKNQIKSILKQIL
jgi:hypothetical protein